MNAQYLKVQISTLTEGCREECNQETDFHLASAWARTIDNLDGAVESLEYIENRLCDSITRANARVVDPYIFMD